MWKAREHGAPDDTPMMLVESLADDGTVMLRFRGMKTWEDQRLGPGLEIHGKIHGKISVFMV